MKTLLKLGPADRGRPLTLEDFFQADYEEGYRYELIDGGLYVGPQAGPPHAVHEFWLMLRLIEYMKAHPGIINFVCPKARIVVSGRADPNAPEPDISAYHDYPLGEDLTDLRWQDQSPILVVEVVSRDDPDKDLVRNVDLYLQVPSIREYWILDGREHANRPYLRVYRRRGQRWQNPIDIPAGGTYTTRLLPDFTLVVDPHA